MFIPYSDSEPAPSFFPRITMLLIVLNAAVFVIELSTHPVSRVNALFRMWGLVPYLVTHAISPQVLSTFITSMFLHGGWFHLIFNMLYLSIFGHNIEASLGDLGYLLFYLVCGLAAGGAHIAIAPSSPLPMIGASGAIAGVMGAYIVAHPRSRIRVFIFVFAVGSVRLPAVLLLGFWFLIQLCSGFGSLGQTSGGTAYFAHIGGFAVGVLLMLIFNLFDDE